MKVQDVLAMMASGANVIVSMTGLDEADGRLLASGAARNDTNITMKQISHLSEESLRGIASSGQRHVTFDFVS